MTRYGVRGLIAALALITGPAWAVDYVQPAGAPEIQLAASNITISIFAVQTPIGHGIGILEKRGSTWFLCGQCLVSPELPTMDAAVKAAGGPEAYIERKREAINAVLASRYPASNTQRSESSVDTVNKALVNSSTLRLVNGVPQFTRR